MPDPILDWCLGTRGDVWKAIERRTSLLVTASITIFEISIESVGSRNGIYTFLTACIFMYVGVFFCIQYDLYEQRRKGNMIIVRVLSASDYETRIIQGRDGQRQSKETRKGIIKGVRKATPSRCCSSDYLGVVIMGMGATQRKTRGKRG